MAIEKQGLGTESDPDVMPMGSAMEIEPEMTRNDEIRNAAEILVREEEILVDDEIDAVEEQIATDFNANLVDFISDSDPSKLASDVISSIKSDKESRSEWEKTYTDGLKYLGMKFDDSRSQPFEGSSGVIHPILAESVTQFQAQAYKELLPAKGPVKTEIVGARSPEVEMQAGRVQDFMNYYIMNVMEEYDPELDMLLFYLPLAGSAFKKVYFDTGTSRAMSKFIEPQDLLCRMKRLICSRRSGYPCFEHESQRDQKAAAQRLLCRCRAEGGSMTVNRSDIEEQIDEIEGMEPSYQEDRDHVVFETHTILDIPGFEDIGEDGEPTGLKLPYIVTIDEQSQKVLSVRRNYLESTLAKLDKFLRAVQILAGLGFTPWLSHMIGAYQSRPRPSCDSLSTQARWLTCQQASRLAVCVSVTRISPATGRVP